MRCLRWRRSRRPASSELLFGDVLGVSSGELLLTAALAVVVLAALRVAHGKLLTVGFDRTNAPAFGASPRAADALLLLLIGGFTIVAVQALGTLLVLAMLVGPAATARLVTHRLRSMMALAAVIAAGRRRRPGCTSPTTRTPRPARRSRPWSSPSTSPRWPASGSRQAHLKAGPVTGLEPAS